MTRSIANFIKGSLLAFFTSAMLFGGAANAASFDCGKAQTSVERAICDNDELSDLDAKLGDAYRYARYGLSDSAADAVRQGQRDWLKFRQLRCTFDAQPQRFDYDEEGVRCLEDLYRTRLDVLARNRDVLGFRFYSIDAYRVQPDTESGVPDMIGTMEYSALRMDGGSALAAEFNGHLAGLYGGTATAHRDAVGFAKSSDSVTLHRLTSRRISTSITGWVYPHGAAHGSYSSLFDHFLIEENRTLVARDIFANRNWEARFIEIVLDRIERDPDLDASWALDSVKATIADPSRWDFSNEGVQIVFSLYQIGPYAIGEPVVTIPWARIDRMLAPGARAIATGS